MPRIAALLPLLPLPALAACITLPPPASGATTGATDTAGDPSSDTADPPLPWPEPPTIDRTGVSTTTGHTTSSSTSSSQTSTSTNPTTTSGVVPDLDGLRITEILADPDGKDGGITSPEFLEIANSSPEPVPLDGLVIRARSWPRLESADLGLTSHTLAPGGRLLLLRHTLGDGPALPIVDLDGDRLTVTFTTTEGLRNADGAAMLLGPNDAILDAVIYGLPAPSPYDDPLAWQGPPAATPGAGRSLCRTAAEADTDRAEDWGECDPTPGEAPAEPGDSTSGTGSTGDTGSDSGDTANDGGTPAIAIIEVLSNAPGPNAGEKALEYVEVLNYGDAPIDLAGFTIADALGEAPAGADPLIPLAGDGGCQPATCLAPGHRALIVGNTYAGPIGTALVLATDDTTIADGGLSALEPVLLRDPDGEVVSTYRVWPDPTSEPYPINIEEPLHRGSPGAPDEPASWSYSPPTPGA